MCVAKNASVEIDLYCKRWLFSSFRYSTWYYSFSQLLRVLDGFSFLRVIMTITDQLRNCLFRFSMLRGYVNFLSGSRDYYDYLHLLPPLLLSLLLLLFTTRKIFPIIWKTFQISPSHAYENNIYWLDNIEVDNIFFFSPFSV